MKLKTWQIVTIISAILALSILVMYILYMRQPPMIKIVGL